MSSVKGVVLAAGFGQRLQPITNAVPKPLLPVGNVPLIGYALKLLAHHGITDVTVNLHHLGQALYEALGDGAAYGVHLRFSEEEEILGTGGGLKRMHSHVADSTIVVVNSDTLVDADITAALASHRQRQALATMVLRQAPQDDVFGAVEVAEDGRILRILGQGVAGAAAHTRMFTGIHILEPRFLEYIPPDINTCINRYAYPKALSNGEAVYGYMTDGYFADAGTPARYFQANADALEQRIRLSHAEPLAGLTAAVPNRAVPPDMPEAVHKDGVYRGTDVELGADVRLVPPVLLADGVRVGAHATVGPYCVIGPRVQIGSEAHVTHAVVLEGSKIDGGATVLRKVVGSRGAVLEIEVDTA